MVKSAKFTLRDLVKLDAELTIKWELELPQNTNVYRGIIPDYDQEIDLETAKTYLLRREYNINEINQALSQYFEMESKPVNGQVNKMEIKKALSILKGQRTLFDEIREKEYGEKMKKMEAVKIYKDIINTKKFLLKNLKGTGIELKFKSKVDGEGADVIIRGWKHFVAVNVFNVNNGYNIGFAPWYIQIMDLNSGDAVDYRVLLSMPLINLLFLSRTRKKCGSRLYSKDPSGSIQKIGTNFIYDCNGSPYYSQVFSHLIGLKAEAEAEIFKKANEIESMSLLSLNNLLACNENLEKKLDNGEI